MINDRGAARVRRLDGGPGGPRQADLHQAEVPAEGLRGRDQRRLRDPDRHLRAQGARGGASGQGGVVVTHPRGDRLGPVHPARPADRRSEDRRRGAGGAADPDAGQGRRADHAGRVPAAGGALRPGARDRPLGGVEGRRDGSAPPRRGEPLGQEHRRPHAARLHRGRADGGRRGPGERGVRDHRDRRRRGLRSGAQARGPAHTPGLRLRARRLRHGLRQLHLPQAPAGQLHQDRHRLRPRAHPTTPPTGRW